MPQLTVGSENSQDINLHFTDHGSGEIVLMIHGYPFSGTAWEKEEAFLLNEGFRVITYDRRGFGMSSRPSTGYDYDTFAKDLDSLMTQLDLHDVTLVGHSMGTGEIARYLATFGSERISRAVFVAPIPPFILKADDNEDGVDQKVFDEFKKAIEVDRYAFITDFLKKFYNTSKILGKPISDEKLRADFILASSASPTAFLKCVDTWTTDFRDDLPKISVPCLVIQGDADEILPFDITGKLLAERLSCELRVIPGGSHGIPWTHADIINEEILSFMRQDATSTSRPVPAKKSDRSASLH
jgi:non-heme chloroperoxidase